MKSLYKLKNRPLTNIRFESSQQPNYDEFDSMFCNLEFEELITVPELRLVKLLSPFGFLLFQNVQNVTISKGSDGMVKIKMKCGHPISGSDQTFILSAKSLVQTIDSAC